MAIMRDRETNYPAILGALNKTKNSFKKLFNN